jgi:tetratricopeptide (TPR) repeat protein
MLRTIPTPRVFTFYPGRPFFLSLLAVPCLIASCASAPQKGTDLSASTGAIGARQAAPPSDPRTYYHFILGYQAELAQDTEEALREYRLALRGDPNSVFLKARLASVTFSTGDAAGALQLLDQIDPGQIDDMQTIVMLAGIYAGAGKQDKALQLYDRAIELNPSSSDPHFSKGVLLVNLKRLPEAERAFQAGIEKSKDGPLGYYYLGRIAIETKEFDKAVANFERAMALSPTFEPAYNALASLYESKQDRAKAIGVYRKYLLEANPRNKEVRQHLIRLYLGEKAYQEALAELQQALRDDPDDLDAHLRIGLVYGELKDHGKAISHLQKILAVRPAELRVRDYLGLMYEEMKDYDRAVAAYRENLRLQPTYADGHLHLGFLLYRLKRSSDAVAHLMEVVKLNPKQPDGHLLLGLTYLQMDRYADALDAFQAGIQQNPGNPDLHFNLGTAYDKLNRFDDVVQAMESTLRLDPKHSDALNYLGYSYADRGIHIEEAVSLIKRAVSIKPNNGYYVDSLGWAFFKMGLLDEALTELKRAAVLVTDDPVIYEHLGEIYLGQNRQQDAREAWLRSLELDPSNSKLMQRFRDRGLGDPVDEERIQQARRRAQNRVTTTPTP